MLKLLNNKILKDFLVYGIGTISTRAIAFLTIPFYTRIFMPEVYGELELFLIVGSLFATLLNIGLDSSLSFFFKVDGNFENKKIKTVSSIFAIFTTWSLLACTISVIIVNYMDLLYYQKKMYLLVFSIFFFETIISLLLNIFRLEMKSRSYTFFQVSNAFLSNTLSVVFLLFWESTIEKLLMGRLIAAGIIFLPLLFKNRKYFALSQIGLSTVKELLYFGIPLFPASFFTYVFTYTDRFFIQNNLNLEQLGIFSAGARLSAIIYLMASSFTLAILPHLLEAIDQRNTAMIKMLQDHFFWAADLCIIVFYIFAELICFILLGESFRGAYIIIGFYIIHPVYSACYNLISAGIWKSKKTYLSTLTMFFSCFINIILTMIFIEFFGLIGVAFSTAISSLIWIYLTANISEKIYATGFNKTTFLRERILLVVSLAILTFIFNNVESRFEAYLFSIMILIIFLIKTWHFNKDIIKKLKNELIN